jgi:hypothetical protein
MSIKINIEHNFQDIQDMMDDLGHSDVVGAARSALNNAIRRGKVQGSKDIKRRINMSATEIRKRITTIKAKGGSLRSVQAALSFSGVPISMINFIVGNKQPIKQKGKSIRKRRKLKARIKSGTTIRLPGAFIQDIQSKHVFRHKGKGRRARKISTKSLAKIIVEKQIDRMFEQIVVKRFQREFKRQVEWRWSKTSKKYARTPMRLPR